MAHTDGLTGINNRQYFEQLAAAEMEKAKRYKTGLSMVMVDIDNFKAINDVQGHMTGDRVLQAFAGILASNIREFDILGRYGGDEFVILLPSTNGAEVQSMLNRIQEALKKVNIPNEGEPMEVAFCSGIAEMKPDDTLETLEDRADRKMYLLKRKKNKQ